MLKLLAIVITGAILLTVIELIRREKLTFKYAFGWMIVSCLGIFFVIFDSFLFKLAYWFGFELPSNFVFFVLISALIGLSLLMTLFLCQQNSRNDVLAQKIGMLELEIDKLKKKGAASNG